MLDPTFQGSPLAELLGSRHGPSTTLEVEVDAKPCTSQAIPKLSQQVTWQATALKAGQLDEFKLEAAFAAKLNIISLLETCSSL